MEEKLSPVMVEYDEYCERIAEHVKNVKHHGALIEKKKVISENILNTVSNLVEEHKALRETREKYKRLRDEAKQSLENLPAKPDPKPDQEDWDEASWIRSLYVFHGIHANAYKTQMREGYGAQKYKTAQSIHHAYIKSFQAFLNKNQPNSKENNSNNNYIANDNKWQP